MMNAQRRSVVSMASLLGVLLLTGPVVLSAQKTSTTATGDKIRTTERYTGEHAPINRPTSVLKVVKVKGILDKIDLEKRTVTIVPLKKKDALELTFPQPSGREQIKASKKGRETTGKKKAGPRRAKDGIESPTAILPTARSGNGTDHRSDVLV